MQSYLLAVLAIGSTVGEQWVRIGLEYFSDRDLWIVCYFNFVLVWATFGTKFHRYRPAFITLVDGDHAVISPSSFSTSSANGPTPEEVTKIDVKFPDDLRARVTNEERLRKLLDGPLLSTHGAPPSDSHCP